MIKLKHLFFTVSLSLLGFTNCGQNNDVADITTDPNEEKEEVENQGDENFEIFLCIGQSNMAGRAEIMDEDLNVLENAFLFNDSSEWEKAENPMNRYSTIRKDLDDQKLSPSWSFAEALEAEGKKVGLVVNAKGGTSMKEWVKGGTFYTEALNRALEAKKTGVLKAIIWHQGESNQNSTSTYTDLFKTMVEGFREDLGIEDLPVIVGEIGKWRESATNINNVLVDLKNHIPNLDYVSALGITHLGDETHFNSQSQRVLGRRYAAKYLEMSGGDANTQLPVLEDTYTNGFAATDVEGAETTAVVKYHPDGRERQIFLKFDISSIPGTITAAKVYFNARTTSGGDFDIEVYESSDDSWSETSTTYDNYTPSYGSFISTFTPAGLSYDTPYSIDITNFVVAEQKTDKIITLVFKTTTQDSSNDFRIVTKEDANGQYAKPYLNIDYNSGL